MSARVGQISVGVDTVARSSKAADRLEIAVTKIQPGRHALGRDLHVLCSNEKAIQLKGLQPNQSRKAKRMVEIQDLQGLAGREGPKSRPKKVPRAGKPSGERLCAESNLNHSFFAGAEGGQAAEKNSQKVAIALGHTTSQPAGHIEGRMQSGGFPSQNR